jgi:hypothetical protein
MSNKTFYATGNLKHNGERYATGDVVKGLSAEEAERLEKDGAVSTDESVTEPEGDAPREQSAEEKAAARKAKGQDTQENKDDSRGPEVGGEANDSGETSVDEGVGDSETGSSDESNDSGDEIVKEQFKVLQGVEFPKGTPHEEGAVLVLSAEEAATFVEGLIEKIESADDASTEL